MSISLRFWSCVIITCLFFSLSSAQQKINPYAVEIKGQQISISPNVQQWFDSMAAKGRNEPAQVILQFHKLPDDLQKQQFSNAGITLLDYIPNYAYTAFIQFPLHNFNAAVFGLRGVTALQSNHKMDERITAQLNLQSAKRIKLLVSFIKQTLAYDKERILRIHDAVITDKRFEAVKTFEIEIAQNKLLSFAENAFIKYIGLPANIKPLNFDARSSSGANFLSSATATGSLGLDGSGVTIGVGDNASAIYHVDVRDRLINFHSWDRSLHGTHTTLTVAGKGIMDPRAQGMAPSASILAHIYDLVWAQTPYMYSDYNMTITNNSYAAVLGDCNNAGVYDQYSQMLDEYQKNYPFVQHVFAAGNDGLMQCGSFPVSYGTVTGGYQPSKNILTVGAMAKDNIIWPKSSRGPVRDGRLKPEIMAYGFQIYSGDIYDTYGGSNGTSMSSPVVAGNLGLIEQRYKQLHANQNIPSDLMKALAMNGATDMGNPGPDFLHGYGLINTYRSIQMLNNNRFIIDSVNNAANKIHNITVPPNTAQLKLMLYWHDDPASPLSSAMLINNLDLQVSDASSSYLPWILDPSPSNVMNNAIRGVDNRNNSEQITIDNPSAGNYTITVKGTFLPAGKQRYVVVYDFIPVGIKLKYPVANVPVPANDSIYVYWDANDDPNSFTLEYSTNNGVNWNVLHNNIAATQRHYVWYTPNLSSSQCLFRVTRNNTSQSDVSGQFVMNPQPVVQLSATQCPGYMAIEWNAVNGVTSYEVLKKTGDDLRPFDTVTTTNYILSGLSFDSLHYAGVRPLVNGVTGWRSKSVKRIPNDGNCSDNISDGDLVADAIINESGRLFTSTALTANHTLALRIRNLDDVVANNYRVSYSINNGAWQSQVFTMPIPAGGGIVINVPGQNFATAGVYKIRFAVENLSMSDPVRSNDSITKFIRQLNNPPVNIGNMFTDDFETAPVFTVLKDTIGILPGDHWDYYNSTDSGRLRSFVSSDVLIDGQRSLSMDILINKPDNQNFLTGTFNLQAVDATNTEARIEFDYKLHGKPKFLSGNEVWIRGNDTSQWLSIYTFDTSATPGKKINTTSLSITNALLNAGQNFSSSFQVRIGQHDTSVIAMNEYGNGLTIDNFKLYSVKNDVQLLSVASPAKFNCSIDSVSVSVRVYNSDNLPQDTVELFYSFNKGAVIRDTIFFLAPKDTITHIFKASLNSVAVGTHTLDIWLRAQGDTYLPNDSILNFRFRNQPNITSFPYLENFETNDGNWYTDGFNSSWQYGMPNSLRLKKAASGTKVWTTNLTGNYNDNEASYLYSPCFDISGLQNPMLSFSLSTHIENCGGTLCDAAYVEYSADGISWTKLGANGEGYNWYGNFGVWNDSALRWRVASIPLPKNIPSLKLRFVMKSDAGAAWDGIAVDDIHIFDFKYPVYDGALTTVNSVVNTGRWVDFISNNGILAQINTSSAPGNTDVNLYNHSYVLHPVMHHYNLSRNYVIHSAQKLSDTTIVRLFISDEEVKRLVSDNQCDTCMRAEDAYRLGITKYDDDNKNNENGSLTDNVNGIYQFIPFTAIQWVPYDKGYYAQTKVNSFSEFWFNTAIPDKVKTAVMIYPNPVTDGLLNITWSGAPGTELKLVMFDAVGRKVYEAIGSSNDFDTKTTFRLPDLETGIYMLRLYLENQTINTKLFLH